MPAPVLLHHASPDDPALDLALSAALLEAVASGEHPAVVRVFSPGPAVAFSRRDALLPGFERACSVAVKHGYAPLLRNVGGRAAAYDRTSLVVEQIVPIVDTASGIRERFEALAAQLIGALRRLALDVRLGELPGEFCPGSHSINLRGRWKVGGLAQRVTPGAALVSAVLLVETSSTLGAVLADVYDALGLPLDAGRTGALAAGKQGITADAVAACVSHELAAGRAGTEAEAWILDAARTTRARCFPRARGLQGPPAPNGDEPAQA